MNEVTYKYSRGQTVYYVKSTTFHKQPHVCRDCDGTGEVWGKIKKLKCPSCDGIGIFYPLGGEIKDVVIDGIVEYISIIINSKETIINYSINNCKADINEKHLYETAEDAEKTIKNKYIGIY